ncbi:peptidyl-prolyl cis-trans isomerase FKBP7 [Nothobranchius furzeri]|uniref:peptidylprolyl isomerase n=1 Tax=Nothobranchius furzeri TaxID=105023 RepID=A0A8C6M9M4_NOTFU|nr:peptidyl-prolyl cis-trans isomerase FKBP7 [Nothobranchius furzeri]KAF7214413.1 FK506 binding protein 7 [Nothobranchius furzeri]
MHSCTMWKLLSCSLCLFVSSQFGICSVWTSGSDPDGEVKVEVVFKPEECVKKSKKGDLVNAHYDGFLAKDGSQFYCSRTDKDGHPQWFVLGVGQVLKGLDVGMMGMCAGEKRKVTIPSALAFGEKGKGPVPPNATVVFEVEVLSVSRGPRSMEAFGQIDQDKDRSLSKAEVKHRLKLDYEKDGKPRDDPFYEKIINDIFRKSDHDRDGLISAKEYNIYEHDEL